MYRSICNKGHKRFLSFLLWWFAPFGSELFDLRHSTFSCWRTSFKTFCRSTRSSSLNVCLIKASVFLQFWRLISSNIEFYIMWFCFVNTSNLLFTSLLPRMISGKKPEEMLMVHLWVRYPPFWTSSIKMISLDVVFKSLKIKCLGVTFWNLPFFGVLWSLWICDIVSVINCVKINFHCFDYFFYYFLWSSSDISLMCFETCVLSIILGYSNPLFKKKVSFYFSLCISHGHCCMSGVSFRVVWV